MTSSSQLNSDSARDGSVVAPLEPEDYPEDYHEDYHDLINDGGRGFVSISLDPHRSRPWQKWDEKLDFWQTTKRALGAKYYRIYQKQLDRWEKFRKWQGDQRGDEEDDSRFLEHAKSMQHRLAEHGFTRSFQLSRDPEQQDRLTTWIEYVNFECWSADNLAKQVKDEEPAYEQLFQDKLRSIDIVDHSVTKESLRLPGALSKYKAEYMDAMKALASMRTLFQTDKVSTADNKRRLSALYEYKRSRHSATEIENFLWKTRSYYLTTVLAALNVKIVEWAIKEVPLVETGAETGIEAFLAEHAL
ncbi:hypothetical protein EDB80DRAFT_703494 [Ilyonectria destructans]|nr:hypothetical protein EDB80DRAFT_703494 [Ilyonectria destructans]